MQDLPAGFNRGYLEQASIANETTHALEKVCFWNASPIISCLISSWKSERAPGHPSSCPISARRDKNVKKSQFGLWFVTFRSDGDAENVGLKTKAKKKKSMNIDLN